MNSGPDISVILFYKEDRGWLDKAIQSYHSQLFTGTSELIIEQGDRSTAENFNAGVMRAKGRFIKYLCDDDELLPYCLQNLYDKAIEGFDVVCAGAMNYNEETGETVIYYSVVPRTIFELAEQNTIHGGSVLFSREALLKVGMFDTSLNYGEEYHCYLKMAAAGMRFATIPDVVYFYRIHNQMKSMQARVDNGDIYLKRKREILHKIQEPFLGNRCLIKK